MKLNESNFVKLLCVLESDLIPISKTTGLSLAQLWIGPLAGPLHFCTIYVIAIYLVIKQTIKQSLHILQ